MLDKDLAKAEVTRHDLASQFIFAGQLMSPDIQIACVPLLLRWISSSSTDQISIGLQALSVAIEGNKRAQ